MAELPRPKELLQQFEWPGVLDDVKYLHSHEVVPYMGALNSILDGKRKVANSAESAKPRARVFATLKSGL